MKNYFSKQKNFCVFNDLCIQVPEINSTHRTIVSHMLYKMIPSIDGNLWVYASKFQIK